MNNLSKKNYSHKLIVVTKLACNFKSIFFPIQKDMGNCYTLLFAFIIMPCFSISVMGQSAFEEKIKNLGINRDDIKDWSEEKSITIPEPKCAYINITGLKAMPSAKNKPTKGWMEVYDNNGNYLKKRVIFDGQGNSSKNFIKRNFKADFCEDNWEGEETTDITIGDWVPQDGFHFKAYWYDRFKGIAVVAYKLYDDVVADRGGYKGRAWSRCGVDNSKFDSRAICHPDGFPVAVYFNGNFYGIYCWQLKKHRKNMNLIKDVPEMIHVDGETNTNYLFGGTVNWNHLEIRNPKKMYTMDGFEYDTDKRGELMDETSEYFNLSEDTEKDKKHKQNTAMTKRYILQFANYYNEMYALYNAKTPAQNMKEEMAKRFDVESLIDYWLFSYFTDNYDGMFTNWQWATWDGIKWYVLPYDLDCTFGLENYGNFIYPPTVCSYRGNIGMGSHPFLWVNKYFINDVVARYAELRDKGVFSSSHVISMLQSWTERIGEDLYADEWKRWPTSPCISEDIINPEWEWVANWSSWTSTKAYSNTTTYHAGDIVSWNYRKWKATCTTTGVPPCKQQGYTDTIERVKEWIDGRLKKMDTMLNYTPKVYVLGDANGDEEVSLNDIMTVIDHVLGISSTNIQMEAADANKDGEISIADVTTIADIILNNQN